MNVRLLMRRRHGYKSLRCTWMKAHCMALGRTEVAALKEATRESGSW